MAKKLPGDVKRLVSMRRKGLSYRAIEEKLGHEGNGTWALRLARKFGVAK